jgi:hypothetical protein
MRHLQNDLDIAAKINNRGTRLGGRAHFFNSSFGSTRILFEQATCYLALANRYDAGQLAIMPFVQELISALGLLSFGNAPYLRTLRGNFCASEGLLASCVGVL